MHYILYPFIPNARKNDIYFIFIKKSDTIRIMRRVLFAFFLGNICIVALRADSLLSAQSFPKTFEDLSFTSRMEVIRDGFAPYDIEYDDNGVCISGCTYEGITIKEDMMAIDEATEEMAELIEEFGEDDEEIIGEIDEEYEPIIVDVNTPQPFPEPHQPSTPAPHQPSTPAPSRPVVMAADWCRNGLSTRLPLRYPVDMTNFKYKISSDFGLRKNGPNGGNYLHGGIDISVPKGTPVYATADGIVEAATEQKTPGGAGWYINIRHYNTGLVTQYLHLQEGGILVKQGDHVDACQQIALSGNSGRPKKGGSYSAHLDYRVRFQKPRNKFVDILCPCKAAITEDSKGTRAVGNHDGMQRDCEHSLFNKGYKFSNSGVKRSEWRMRYGHCMKHKTDLLPDEK